MPNSPGSPLPDVLSSWLQLFQLPKSFFCIVLLKAARPSLKSLCEPFWALMFPVQMCSPGASGFGWKAWKVPLQSRWAISFLKTTSVINDRGSIRVIRVRFSPNLFVIMSCTADGETSRVFSFTVKHWSGVASWFGGVVFLRSVEPAANQLDQLWDAPPDVPPDVLPDVFHHFPSVVRWKTSFFQHVTCFLRSTVKILMGLWNSEVVEVSFYLNWKVGNALLSVSNFFLPYFVKI